MAMDSNDCEGTRSRKEMTHRKEMEEYKITKKTAASYPLNC